MKKNMFYLVARLINLPTSFNGFPLVLGQSYACPSDKVAIIQIMKRQNDNLALQVAQYRSTFQNGIPGARLTKAYDVTIQRYRNTHEKIQDSKMHILRCMGSKFHTKFWTHTPQNMHFTMW